MTKLLIVCIDGGTKYRADREQIEQTLLSHLPFVPVPLSDLRSVFPSSTAPAHASFFSGELPANHGILGNYYEISTKEKNVPYDPLNTFHPYSREGISCLTLLDDFNDRKIKWASVHMPQTVSRSSIQEASAIYVLYSPPVHMNSCFGNNDEISLDLNFHNRTVSLCINRENLLLTLKSDSDFKVSDFTNENTKWITIKTSECFIGFHLYVSIKNLEVTVVASRAAVYVGLESISESSKELILQLEAVDCEPRFPLVLESYREVPTERWVTETALILGKDTNADVLLVRYNQADHAQEQLGGMLQNSDPLLVQSSDAYIQETYHRIIGEIAQLIKKLVNIEHVLIFSDHGSSKLNRIIPVPWLLKTCLNLHSSELVWADSCILYLKSNGEFPNGSQIQVIKAMGIDIYIKKESKQIFSELVSTGSEIDLLMICDTHSEFEIGNISVGVKTVQASGHGGDPYDEDLLGLFILGSTRSYELEPPDSLLDLRLLINTLINTGEGTVESC